ncbi:MAG: hypothetical protein HY609_02140 [Deltaproteobacteria bacterium]|nr:hypothetical protein [Deltaproteobacteria bacterium]
MVSCHFSFPLWSYRNAALEEEARAYRKIQQLISFGLVDKVIVGNKPWPRREMARIIREAESHLDRLRDVEQEIRAKMTLKYLKEAYAPELEGESTVAAHPFKEFSLEYLLMDSPSREIPIHNGSGDQIAAFVNPLTAYQRGRSYQDNHNFGLLTRHIAELTQHLSLAGRSHFLLQKQSSGPDAMRWGFDELYLRGEFKNIGLQIGRDMLAWGPAPEGGVFYSSNATPLDMFKISNASPFYYPWIFKYLGPAQASFHLAVLGSNRDIPHPYVAGWKLSFLPHKNFEFGFTHAVMAGGEGSADASFGNRVTDVFGVFASLGARDPNISNRVGGFDFTWRFPGLRGLNLYYEILMEDTKEPAHWDLMFWHEAINQVGLFLPQLSADGTQTLRFEFQRAGFRPYRHHQYTSGWTQNGRLMGSELGPDAYGFMLEFGHEPTPYFHQRHSFHFESRDSDVYFYGNQATVLRKTEDNPAERRYRLLHTLEWYSKAGQRWFLQAGYERVQQFNFVAGQDINNFLIHAGFTFYPKI